MTRYKLILEYDGTDTVGWQTQADGVSVQSLLQDAIFQFCKERVEVVAAGRTDAGVHALAMTAHFDLEKEAEPETVMAAVNFHLNSAPPFAEASGGRPVSVLACKRVDENFHARFGCRMRRYKYVILNRRAPVVLDKNRVWWVPRPLDIDAMRAAAVRLVGEHDWTSFRAAECQGKSPIKTLDEIKIISGAFQSPDNCALRDFRDDTIIFEFSARSFLHHQVRNMVGTLVEIGLGKPYDIDEIFTAKNRAAAGPTAPASGLYFVGAEY
ncbi:MAG: tRNA pseudouridine(38-40) synthase TruA [Alphaproteobacteria bacterium]|nr:tRNA pseudouridine(38-40) synthase TruA [Alphaproteobacteria bacterium]